MAKPKVKVIDRGWNKIQKQALTMSRGKAVAVGYQGSEAELVDPAHGEITNVELGAIHEFGTQDGHTPERSHIRSTFDENQAKYEKGMKEVSRIFFEGKKPDGELLLVGEELKSDIINKVRSGDLEPLAESTMMTREGGAIPLWNTGQLMNSLTAVVTDDPASKRDG